MIDRHLPQSLLLLPLLLLSCQSDDAGSESASQGSSAASTQDSEAPTTGTSTDATATATTQGESDAGSQSGSQSGGSSSSGGSGSSSSSGSETSGTAGGCPGEPGLAPVELGDADDPAAAGSHVLLAKTAITNVTGSALSGGDVGLSPAAATFITGFSLIADPSNEYSTSVVVLPPWRVYAATYAAPTPSNLTKAVSVMEAAYTDAAGRPTPDYLNLEGGDLGGLTLAPGLYTWGSTVLIPTDVTIAGCAEDVWIFQIADDLDVSAAASVILSGGAQAQNIFWQVAGQATIHADAHVEGIILSKTGITLQTSASLHGRALAQSMIALDDNVVTAP